ncbi:MAG: hypothetical protein ABIK09_20650 [Pseudomonadota bacterium]
MIATLILTAVFAVAPAKTITGDGTTLTTGVTEHPVYDGAPGKTHLRLAKGDDIVIETDWPGIWRGLACDAEEHRYVLTGEFQQGGWLPIRQIRYLNARSGIYTESQYNGRDFLAFTAVAAADGRWVALVGLLAEGADFKLLLLDTRRDAMVELGVPPAPTPSTDVAPKDLGVDCPWTSWSCFHDGWVDLEPGIITFKDGRLEVSYGEGDSPQGRDRKRTVRSWDLEKTMKKAGVGGK